MSIKKWAIKKLGGITQEEFEGFKEGFRDSCEGFYKASQGTNVRIVVEGNCTPDIGDDVFVGGSYVRVVDGRPKEITVAPWCRNVLIANNIIGGE